MDHESYRSQLATTHAGSEQFFSTEEFRRRRERVARAMEQWKLDALLITDVASIYYLTGYKTFEVSVHTALIFRPDHCLLQVPSIETGPAVTTAVVDEITDYRWEAVASVVEPLVAALSGAATIGYSPWGSGLRHGLMDALKTRLSTSQFRDAAELLNQVRLVKSETELRCLRESARITQSALDAAIQLISPGIDENSIAAAGAQALLAEGSEFMSLQPIVTSGPRSSVIHLNHSARVIEAGDPVFLEFGANCQRYTAPMMRTAIAGREPTTRMRQLNEACRSLYRVLAETMHPGNRFCDAARAAEAELEPLADEVFFSGVFGYSVGAQFPPSWVEGTGFIARDQQQSFEPGMVFHLPLCLRIPGQWGIGMSNTVVVGEHRAEPLTHNNWELAVCH